MNSRLDHPPRKVTIATVMQAFAGHLAARLALLEELVRAAGRTDLIVFPEAALQSGRDGTAAERAVVLAGELGDRLGTIARDHRTYLVVPMFLAEKPQVSNAAVVFDRSGQVTGIYRKVHPVASPDDTLEGGVTPGAGYPVFDCDFGKLGVQICWDMSHEDGWLALARQDAEIVAVPSASPQTVRPAMYALRGRYYVVTSTPRNNATIFDPLGLPAAQRTTPGLLVQEVDLAYAILHWSERLDSGRALTRAFGERVGYRYSEREDTGLFWSNDPTTPIGRMIRELGLEEMPDHIERSRRLQDAARGGPGVRQAS